ncbi:DNA-binding response regulator, OmpR family, contains REC and winged-helix (wHTH) domain [Marininema mesophilum]|uniref:DNA-binding response regulator, OmpR family, contains REC and winged-helix (WHTH) domain n=1 Tax=Marininema mesophilum TaxID=1048340 RepID=A0A1H3AHV5_9BACL|nr:response regulator transcription factor [Marininema mesophilum]SDX29041.1 DNA-binding response regulator, OmpR family, contains REC and winged-helix (wHTH) domain [Marininema mesophilum]
MDHTNLLLVDDEPEILQLLTKTLHSEGFQRIFTAGTGHEAIQICAKHQPDVILLDVMLPDMEGYEVCKKLREITHSPIFFLTARTTDLDKLMGYNMGADDYIEKPFNPLIIVAKIKAQLKRDQLSQTAEDIFPQPYDFGDFKLVENTGQLFVKGEEISCTAKEFKLLAFLCKHPHQIFSMGQLYRQVWGEESFGYENTVMVHIGKIRKKIEPDVRKPKYIVTIRGLGYKFIGNLVGSQ